MLKASPELFQHVIFSFFTLIVRKIEYNRKVWLSWQEPWEKLAASEKYMQATFLSLLRISVKCFGEGDNLPYDWTRCENDGEFCHAALWGLCNRVAISAQHLLLTADPQYEDLIDYVVF